METLRTVDTAERLGVSDRQVRYLVERGELVSPQRGHVSIASIDAYVARHGDVRARVWAPRTAWAAIELLAGGSAEWLGSSQRSRLRKSLLTMDVHSVISRLRNRADVRMYQFEPERIDAVSESLVVVRSGDDAIDGYVSETALQHLIAEQEMVRRESGNLIARVLDDDIGQDFVEVIVAENHVLAAIDLAGSAESGERALGVRLVSEALSDLV